MPGGRPVQKRMRWLCAQIGQPIEQVCASNLIFVRSRDERTAGYPHMADICWPVHEAILEIVQPRVILTRGCKVYDYVAERISNDRAISDTFPSGHGNWSCRRATLDFSGGPIDLVQLPHLSRYDPRRSPSVIDSISRLLKSEC
jgi:hypothetical protein